VTNLRHRVDADEVLFLALLGILATLIGYRFGFGNQVEQLPIVLRLLDASYLSNDFYVESASQFGPRFYYAHLVVALARLAPLHVVFFALTLFVNLAIVTISHFATRRLLGGDKLAGFVSATLVIAVSSFALGMVTDIRFGDFQPGSLAIPFALAALWAGLVGRPILAGTLAAVASIPHPLYGVETGAVALATSFVSGSFKSGGGATRSSVLRSLAWSAGGAGVLGASTFLLWGIPTIGAPGEAVSTVELVSILAELRAPHHYLPSQFPLRHYVGFAAFGLAFTLAWMAWRETRGDAGLRDYTYLVPSLIVVAACVGGFVFVELWPSRLWVTAQPFRMLYLVKWQGLLLLGLLCARWIRSDEPARRWLGWLAIAGSSGGVHALVACICVLADRVMARPGGKRLALHSRWVVTGVALLTMTLLGVVGSINSSVLVVLAALVALLLLRTPSLPLRYALPVLAVAIVSISVVLGRSNLSFAETGLTPILSFDDIHSDEADAARWARENVDADALFVAPPELGVFRLLAHRALVVDWKALPFEGRAMREWRERIRFCYGEVESGGFPARHQLEQQYRRVTDAKLSAIGSRYGARYALLYLETPTTRPVIYSNNSYRIVALQAKAARESKN
jgi:hypothetical protein